MGLAFHPATELQRQARMALGFDLRRPQLTFDLLGGSNTRPPGGQVAQLVEQRTENPRVGGSIPPLATIFSSRIS